mgnify:FL=1
MLLTISVIRSQVGHTLSVLYKVFSRVCICFKDSDFYGVRSLDDSFFVLFLELYEDESCCGTSDDYQKHFQIVVFTRLWCILMAAWSWDQDPYFPRF